MRGDGAWRGFCFLRGGSQLRSQDSDLLAHCPIPLIWTRRRLFRSPAPFLRATIPLSFASFICSRSILAKPKVCIFTFSNTGHSHRMCTDVSYSAPYLLHEGVFALLILCSMHCRLMCQLGALPTFCNVSCPVYVWIEHTWVVLQNLPQLSDTHFSQVLNKLEKNFFRVLSNIISLSISSQLY